MSSVATPVLAAPAAEGLDSSAVRILTDVALAAMQVKEEENKALKAKEEEHEQRMWVVYRRVRVGGLAAVERPHPDPFLFVLRWFEEEEEDEEAPSRWHVLFATLHSGSP